MIITHYLWLIGQNIFLIPIGVFGIGFLIGFHELGHFLFCKLFGIRTPSFSIGFGPKIASKKIGDTEFSISLIPLGGYVEIAGSAEVGQGDQKEALSTDKDSFAIKPYYQKLAVMFGGILFNTIFAYAALILLFMVGIPKSPLLYPINAIPVVQEVTDQSPAQTAGIQKGDRILAINDEPISTAENIISIVQKSADLPLALTVKKENEAQPQQIKVTIGSRTIGSTTIGTLGVIFEQQSQAPISFFQAISHGVELTNRYIYKTIGGFFTLFAQRNIDQMAGPLMIIQMAIKGAAEGFQTLLLLLAIISINLAALNVIPLPILDGGQILFCTIEAIFRRPLPLKVKEYIHIASWLAILALIIYLSINDLMRIVAPHFDRIKALFGY